MLGPPQQQPQYPQYHGHPPSSQSQYPSNGNGIPHDGRAQHTQQHTNGHSNGADMNNPYQQYAAGYGQSPQYPQGQPQQPQQQLQQQQQPQYPSQHQQHQQQMSQAQRYNVPNQLPPLGQTMGSSSMVPAVTESQSSQAASPANPPPQPSSYMPAPAQSMHQQQSQALVPPSARPSVSATSNTPKEKKMFSSSARDGLQYSLEVVQQPQRARMCGFGDKDRRPITPPPCVRLVITDIETGREVDVSELASDPSFFLLQCDLWAESADREANVVRASSNSPAVSISSATTTSYPPPLETAPRHLSEQHGLFVDQSGHPIYATTPGYVVPGHRPYAMPGYAPQNMYYPNMPHQVSYMQPQQNNAMYTRNLIGSLTVNAAKLTDDAGKSGYWFVLQDLSVRTEGFFRLRMSFVDISSRDGSGVNRSSTPVLAWTFSDKFQVYSAKKFPGVIESTALSKAFASQGIKIPIRKDNKNDAQDDDDGD